MRTYTWEEYYEKFYDWEESTQIKNLSYLESLGDADEVAEVIAEFRHQQSVGNRLLKRAVDAKLKFSGDSVHDFFFWEFDKELSMKALMNSIERFTSEEIGYFTVYVEDSVLLDICKRGNIPIPEELRDYEEDRYDWKPQSLSKSDLRESYDYVLQCLSNAHEKLILAYRLSISDVGSKKRSVSILKHACLVEAEPFIEEARIILEEIESEVSDKMSVQNTRLNLGKNIMLHDIWGDGLITDWMVQSRIRKIIKTVEDSYKEVQNLRKKL